ncbi:MAG: hypothetical protein VW268_03390 [Rhodospirillaceae bacterium]
MPIVRTVGAQLVGGVAAVAVTGLVKPGGGAVPPWALCTVWGLTAAAVSLPLGLSRWWLPVQALAPVLLWAALKADIPGWLVPAALVLMLGVYWNAVGEGVPLYRSDLMTRRALEGLVPDRPGARVADLGSGLGGTLLHLSKARPGAAFTGVETAPLVYAACRLRHLISPSGNLQFRFQSLWRTDLSAFDMVYCFLSPVPMPQLFAKAAREMPRGSILVSNTFEVPNHAPDEVVELTDGRRTRLLIWHMDRHRDPLASPLRRSV